MQIDADGNIWFMANRLPLYIYSSLDENDYNFRIFKAPAAEVLANSPC